MSGALIAAGVVAAGAAAYAGYSANQASKKAASQMRNGVQTFDPIAPNYYLNGAQRPNLVDWRTASNEALAYNLAHQADQQQLAAQTNVFNTGQAKRMYRRFQPAFDTLQSQIGQNALSFSRGELPQDVVASLGRSAATRGLSLGFGQGTNGGGNGTALGSSLLRGLGLTSLDLSKFGTQLAMQASLQAKQLAPPLADPTGYQVTPQQAIGYSFQNAQTQNEAARYWNQVQNNALMQNTGAQNQANMNATNTELAGQLAQAQSIQAAGSALGGAVGTYATNQGSYIHGDASAGYGQPAWSGSAIPTTPSGYGRDAGGFYKLY